MQVASSLTPLLSLSLSLSNAQDEASTPGSRIWIDVLDKLASSSFNSSMSSSSSSSSSSSGSASSESATALVEALGPAAAEVSLTWNWTYDQF